MESPDDGSPRLSYNAIRAAIGIMERYTAILPILLRYPGPEAVVSSAGTDSAHSLLPLVAILFSRAAARSDWTGQGR